MHTQRRGKIANGDKRRAILTSETIDALRHRSRSFGKRTQITNGTSPTKRWRSLRGTESPINGLSTAQGLPWTKAVLTVSGFVGQGILRLTILRDAWIKELRRNRVDQLRSRAWNGGDVDRYVQARKEFWYRYER